MKKNNIYFIEYKNSIKFYTIQHDFIFELYKNDFTFKQLQKVINSKKYNFINLLNK